MYLYPALYTNTILDKDLINMFKNQAMDFNQNEILIATCIHLYLALDTNTILDKAYKYV